MKTCAKFAEDHYSVFHNRHVLSNQVDARDREWEAQLAAERERREAAERKAQAGYVAEDMRWFAINEETKAQLASRDATIARLNAWLTKIATTTTTNGCLQMFAEQALAGKAP